MLGRRTAGAPVPTEEIECCASHSTEEDASLVLEAAPRWRLDLRAALRCVCAPRLSVSVALFLLLLCSSKRPTLGTVRADGRPPSAPHPPASRIDYTLSLQAQGHAFFDAFDFHTIDYNYGAAQYVTRDDAFATRLVDSSGPSSPPAESWAVVRIEDFLGAPSRTTAPRKRKSVKLISKRSWNRFLVRPSYAAHAKPFS